MTGAFCAPIDMCDLPADEGNSMTLVRFAATTVLTFSLSPAFAQSVPMDHWRSGDPVSTAANAQSTAPPAAPAESMPSWGSLFSDLPHDFRRLPSKTNALWLGGAGALAFGLHNEDATLTRKAVGSAELDATLEAGAFIGGGFIQVGGALGTFAIGRLSGRPEVASVGADLVRAQIINTVLTQGIKIAVGRQRPDGTRFSFPSGHTSSSFATAAVLQRRLGWKVGAPAYAMATYVAASRLQENKHYLSDVIFGAAVGIVSGRAVTVGHGRNTFALVPLTPSGGVGIGLTSVGSQ